MRCLLFLLCPLLFVFFGGATYVVPDYTPTIQVAIDSAATGDTVLVREGTYVENLQIYGKALTLKALGSTEATIIDGNQAGSVIEVTSDVHIEGFTIRNGLNEDGGGIQVIGVEDRITVSIVDNIITGNRAGYFFDQGLGGGIVFYRSEDCVVEGNTIEGNYAGYSGGGISFSGVNGRFDANRFVGNGAHVGGGAIHLEYFYPGTEITNNLILENWADYRGGGISNAQDASGTNPLLIQGNTIIGNHHNNVFAAGAGIVISRADATIQNNFVALNDGPSGRGTGVGIQCFTSYVRLQCNDAWGNDVDYDLSGCDTTGGRNISVDPRFCDPENGDYSFASDSPCRENGPSGCGLIGAFGIGCQGTPIVPMTWGQIKTAYGKPR